MNLKITDFMSKDLTIKGYTIKRGLLLQVGIMTAAGLIAIGIGSGRAVSWPWQEVAAVVADSTQSLASNPVTRETEQEETKAPETEKASAKEPYVPTLHPDSRPTPGRLNMAFRYPEGTTKPEESYAGKAFADLNQMDANWISQIYSNSSTAPDVMAARIGYNGSTGGLTEWNRVNVTFYNGDGTPISGYSNAKEILSLASVYAYFNGIKSQEEFYAYAEKLWKDSHRYSLSMSDVYYCDGMCLLSDPDEEREAENLPEELSSLDRVRNPGGEASHPPAVESIPDSAEAEDWSSLFETGIPDWAYEGPGASPEAAEGSDGTTTESTEEETLPETAAATPETTEASESSEAAAEETTPDPKLGPGVMPVTHPPVQETETVEIGPGVAVATPAEAAQTSNTAGTDVFGTDESGESSSGESESRDTPCPGHIDLNIRAVIVGLDGNRNLYSIDSVGNSKERYSGNWYGWGESRRTYVSNINEQDWYEEYGLTISTSMYIRNPLSASEIQHYMSLLPEETSSARKNLIRQALQTVGSIPYYWGGKPSGPGLEANGFGTIVTPDDKGRMLRGLDCSGWIAWVYWTALGWELPYQSTSGLCALGTGISRSDLKAGDIIVRTGEDAHVYMFLAWAENDAMYLIHETGGITNNVTVGVYNVDWPYNRRLVND